VRLTAELERPGAVLLQFIFTTCSTICPVASGTFAAVQEKLPEARLLSISIDPEEDTPARLAAYARRFGAGPRWRLLTGRQEDVIAVEQAFDAYRGNKMRHEPLVFARAGPRQPWLRLAGMPNAGELAAEVRRLVAAGAGNGGGDAAAERQAAARERGRRLYRDGMLPSGQPLRAVVAGDVPAEGGRLACAECHRPSGYGGVEGGALAPPITGPSLFAGGPSPAADLLGRLYQEELAQASWTRLRSAAAERPAYTTESLAAAVRLGRDPSGQALDPLMPRYALDDGAMDDLAAYLRTLSAAPSPGVDAAAIHFAVVVAGEVDAERRRAMLEVVDAFMRWKNADTRRLLARPATSPGYRDELLPNRREWQVEVWELRGLAASWPEQLERRYRRQPVFALLSGIGTAWRPVHEFCERREIPCLFPNTDLPVDSPAGAYTIYLSRGLALEGRALARYLQRRSAAAAEGGGPQRVLQVFRDEAAARTAAAALREAIGSGVAVGGAPGAGGATGAGGGQAAAPAGIAVEDIVIGAGEAAAPAALTGRLGGEPVVLVLWLDRADVAALAPALVAGGVREVYLSYSLLGEDLPPLPASLAGRTRLTYRFALPGAAAPAAFRARAWLRSRGVAGAQERIRLDTLFALSAAADALDRLAGHFSRDYFVETIERETERTDNPGVFPRLGLGAGQRFAAKGCYIVKPIAGGPDGDARLAAVSELIIP
jgi:hypothetical protein